MVMIKGLFEIWQPRYHDRVVLLDERKVIPNGMNLVKITRAKSWNGSYTVNGRKVVECPVESNGKINCYAVPLNLLNPMTENRKPRMHYCPNCGVRLD